MDQNLAKGFIITIRLMYLDCTYLHVGAWYCITPCEDSRLAYISKHLTFIVSAFSYLLAKFYTHATFLSLCRTLGGVKRMRVKVSYIL